MDLIDKDDNLHVYSGKLYINENIRFEIIKDKLFLFCNENIIAIWK
jgi:hypothetical protein